MKASIQNIKPFLFLTVAIMVSMFLFMLFLKLFVLGVIIAVVLYGINMMMSFFKKPTARRTEQPHDETRTHQEQSPRKGRTFDHDEFK